MRSRVFDVATVKRLPPRAGRCKPPRVAQEPLELPQEPRGVKAIGRGVVNLQGHRQERAALAHDVAAEREDRRKVVVAARDLQ